MTVAELIRELTKHNSDLLVSVDGYESGHTLEFDVSEIKAVKQEDKNDWWNGEYCTPFDNEPNTITLLNIGGRT